MRENAKRKVRLLGRRMCVDGNDPSKALACNFQSNSRSNDHKHVERFTISCGYRTAFNISNVPVKTRNHFSCSLVDVR